MKRLKEHKYSTLLFIVTMSLVLLYFLQASSMTDFWKSILNSILISLITGSLTSITLMFFQADPDNQDLKSWKLVKIYKKRSEKNKDSDPQLDKAKEQVNVIAFGLKSFRENYTDKVRIAVSKGVKFRIITMDPTSPFIKQRDKEENKTDGATADSVKRLVDWAKEINKTGPGHISIKSYDCMTLDFYWRVDDDLYIGPYWFGKESQDTITYKFEKGGDGFDLYVSYFEDLWNNEQFKNLVR